jgi:2-keto-4-pentenoate hydratase
VQLIAEAACADQFALGPATPAPWREVDLSKHPATATVGGQTHRGIGANALGDPRIALTWLANELREIGVGLDAGLVVTTGTCLTPIAVASGDRVEADCGPFGRVCAAFAE